MVEVAPLYSPEERQDSPLTGVHPLIIFSAVFGFQVGTMLIGEAGIQGTRSNGKLESDPMCGLVTGGMEECYWDCDNQDVLALQIGTNFDCIADCIPAECGIFSNVLQDIRDNGVCEGSLLHQLLEFRNISIRTGECKYFLGIPILLTEGTCSVLLSSLLSGEEPQQCLEAILTLPPVVVDTIFAFVSSSCSLELPDSEEEPWNEAACYETCQFIEVNGYETNIVEDIECLRGCFQSPGILSLYDVIHRDGACEDSPVAMLKSSSEQAACSFLDISASTEPALPIISEIFLMTLLPLTWFSCAFTVLFRGGVLGSLATCSSLLLNINSIPSLQLLLKIFSLPDFVLQSNILWFISSSLFSSVSSFISQSQTFSQTLNITINQEEIPLQDLLDFTTGFVNTSINCFRDASEEDGFSLSKAYDCLGYPGVLQPDFLDEICEYSFLHTVFLALGITVTARPCNFYLGLPFLPIEGTCELTPTLSTINATLDVNQLDSSVPFPSVPSIFSLVWISSSCSFSSPAVSIFSLPDILPPSSGIMNINAFYEISKCIDGEFSEIFWTNITSNVMRNVFSLEEEDLDSVRYYFPLTERLPPIASTSYVGGTKLNFEHTRHRYPWICSLRKRGAGKQHLCSVTLLSRPPQPTVLVGAAHCTFLCRGRNGGLVPDCCCGGELDCSADRTLCPDPAAVQAMTGEEAEILCGEWQTGDSPAAQQETFNILLPILEIIRHPGYAIGNRTAFLANDVAVFKVDDSELRRAGVRGKVYPACLPLEPLTAEEGVHAGWTTPPSLQYVQTVAPGYQKYFPDFLKQWHYKMKLTACQDVYHDIFPSLSRSRSYYPPGTVCARDKTNSSCFYSGSSGSPLMVRERERPDRFYVEGILSYITGCDYFYLGPEPVENSNFTLENWILSQKSQNPAVYTKLACFLPWIAEQYDLTFDQSGLPAACDNTAVESVVDNNVDDERCLTVPEVPFQLTLSYQGSELVELLEAISGAPPDEFYTETFLTPLPCIFPFYLDDKLHNSCIFIEENGFRIPVFLCPVRNVTTKISGVNSFSSVQLRRLLYIGLCEAEEKAEGDLLPPLLPDCQACGLPRVAFSACTNNCPGVTFPIVSGGTALLFAAATASTSPFSSALVPAMLGLGLAGLGGSMVACVGPLYCTAQSGQCCLVLINTRGPLCPATC